MDFQIVLPWIMFYGSIMPNSLAKTTRYIMYCLTITMFNVENKTPVRLCITWLNVPNDWKNHSQPLFSYTEMNA